MRNKKYQTNDNYPKILPHVIKLYRFTYNIYLMNERQTKTSRNKSLYLLTHSVNIFGFVDGIQPDSATGKFILCSSGWLYFINN